MVLSIYQMVYVLVTGGPAVTTALGTAGGDVVSLVLLFNIWRALATSRSTTTSKIKVRTRTNISAVPSGMRNALT
jgi:hypothetical protein